MSQKLNDQQVEDLIQSMWAQTVDDDGTPLEAETAQGQMALEIVSKIVGAAIVLHIKPNSEVINLDDHRKAD